MPMPYIIAINLTRRCNLACTHCYADALQRNETPQDELTTAEVVRLLEEIGTRAPGTVIVLTGGEPLLRTDVDALVERGAAAGLHMVIGTNGALLTDSRIRRLKAAGLSGAGISLDAVQAAQHDAFRGVQGSFDRACGAVRLSRQHALHAQIHFTVTRANRRQLARVVPLARDLGASIVNFFFLICVGRGQGIIDLTPDEYEEALRQIARLQAESPGIMVQARCAPHFKRVLYERDPDSPFTRATGYDGGGCVAATHYCRVDPAGEVTPCPYIEMSAGNLRRRPFWEIWEHAPLFAAFRQPALEGRCGQCQFKLVCGGCRARSLVNTGRLFAEDPNCNYVPRGENVIAVLEQTPIPEGHVAWTAEARARLKHIPIFLRPMVRKKLEERAASEGVSVTGELMQRHKEERERELGIAFK